MKKVDREGHYAALNISPGASQTEIRLAYEMLKQAHKASGRKPPPKVRAAYETLSDPLKRSRYDAGPASLLGLLKRPDGRSRLDSVPVLIGAMLVLVAALLLTVGPTLKVQFTRFDVGDELYWRATSKPCGLIEEYEEQHPFPDGTRMAAYRVRPASGETPSWHPARDLHRHAAPR